MQQGLCSALDAIAVSRGPRGRALVHMRANWCQVSDAVLNMWTVNFFAQHSLFKNCLVNKMSGLRVRPSCRARLELTLAEVTAAINAVTPNTPHKRGRSM